MSVKIIYFVHGTSIDNENHVSSGWKDVELSKLGYLQAEELREQTENLVFDVVFCSDLRRAQDTAHIAFNGRCPIYQDIRLRECNYGEYDGKASSVVEPMQEMFINNSFPQGESYEEIKIRIMDFLDYIRENYDDKTVGIVAHKGPQLALDVIIKNMSWEEAFKNDWRKTGAWQPGWEYNLI